MNTLQEKENTDSVRVCKAFFLSYHLCIEGLLHNCLMHTILQITSFNPLDGNQAATVVDNKFLVWDLGQESPQLLSVGTMQSKGQINTNKLHIHLNFI